MLSLFLLLAEPALASETMTTAPTLLEPAYAASAPVEWNRYGPIASQWSGEVPGPMGGKQILSFGGSLSRTSVDSNDTMNFVLQAAFGYFLTDEHEVGGQLTTYISDSDDFEFTSRSLGAFYNYNIPYQPNLWFYGGAHAGISIYEVDVSGGGDYDETGFAFGPHGGARLWISASAAIFVEPRITFAFLDDTETIIEVLFGYSMTL